MCDRYIITKYRVEDNSCREAVSSYEIPDDAMPLCGCWLFSSLQGDDFWDKIRQAHEGAGNTSKYHETKRLARELDGKVRDRLVKSLRDLSYDEELVIEKI